MTVSAIRTCMRTIRAIVIAILLYKAPSEIQLARTDQRFCCSVHFSWYRWLKTVSSPYILMGLYNLSLSLDQMLHLQSFKYKLIYI